MMSIRHLLPVAFATLSLLVVTSEAHPQTPSPTPVTPALGSSADAHVQADVVAASDSGPATEPANCQSAIDRQARLAKAAADKRARKAAITAAQYTIDEAKRIAAAYREGAGIAFLKASERRGKAYLERSVSEQQDPISSFDKALCVALSARDRSQCDALSPTNKAACEAWIELAAGVKSGCDSLVGQARGACLSATSDVNCETLTEDERGGCERVRGAEALQQTNCQTALDPATCTWALLVRGLSQESAGVACAPVSPAQGGRSPAHNRVLTTCRAVLEGRPLSCPAPLSKAAVHRIAVWSESEVISQQNTRRVVTNVQTYEPAMCELSLALKREGRVEGSKTVVVATESWVSMPIWSDFSIADAEGELVASTRATCAPRASWTAK